MADFEYLDYKNHSAVDGNSSSVFEFKCDIADFAAIRSLFLGALDSHDTNLKCVDVDYQYLNGDKATGLYRCHAHFVPYWRIDSYTVDQPFRIRRNYGQQAFTLTPTLWTWDSGAALPASISPIKVFGVDEIVLFGTRSSFDSSTYDAFAGTISSDTFDGAAAGCVMYLGATSAERMIGDGTIVWDVEVHLAKRSESWNKFWNEETSAWEEIKRGTNKLYATTAYASLLNAPA